MAGGLRNIYCRRTLVRNISYGAMSMSDLLEAARELVKRPCFGRYDGQFTTGCIYCRNTGREITKDDLIDFDGVIHIKDCVWLKLRRAVEQEDSKC